MSDSKGNQRNCEGGRGNGRKISNKGQNQGEARRNLTGGNTGNPNNSAKAPNSRWGSLYTGPKKPKSRWDALYTEKEKALRTGRGAGCGNSRGSHWSGSRYGSVQSQTSAQSSRHKKWTIVAKNLPAAISDDTLKRMATECQIHGRVVRAVDEPHVLLVESASTDDVRTKKLREAIASRSQQPSSNKVSNSIMKRHVFADCSGLDQDLIDNIQKALDSPKNRPLKEWKARLQLVENKVVCTDQLLKEKAIGFIEQCFARDNMVKEGFHEWLAGATGCKLAQGLNIKGFVDAVNHLQDVFSVLGVSVGEPYKDILYRKGGLPGSQSRLKWTKGTPSKLEAIVSNLRAFCEGILAHVKDPQSPVYKHLMDRPPVQVLNKSDPPVQVLKKVIRRLMRNSQRGPDCPLSWASHDGDNERFPQSTVTDALLKEIVEGLIEIIRQLFVGKLPNNGTIESIWWSLPTSAGGKKKGTRNATNWSSRVASGSDMYKGFESAQKLCNYITKGTTDS